MASIINSTTTAGVTVTGDNSGSLQLATNNGTTAVTIDTSQTTTINSPSSTPLIVQSAGTERMRITSAGDVGIGTSSPSGKLEVSGGQLRVTASSASSMFLVNPSTTYADGVDIQATYNGAGSFGPLKFTTSSTERMRITSGGDLLVGTSSHFDSAYTMALQVRSSTGGLVIKPGADSYTAISFRNAANSQIGSITTTASATAYNTSSDYRLKENIAPMTGALDKVAQLKPVTYTWKVDGSDGQGFIAHELQAVVPDCVTGEKDGVETYTDEDGNEQTKPKYQGVDTSFLVATLTAAIQELKAQLDESNLILTSVKTELDTTKAEVQALKGVA